MGEIRNQAKDRTFYWVETVIIPIRSGLSAPNEYLSLRLLITEKKKAEMERVEYTLRLREMLEMTSHRVRAPLATCLGIMNMLSKDSELSQEERERLFLHLKQSAQHLDQFTHELTAFLTNLEKRYQGIAPKTE